MKKINNKKKLNSFQIKTNLMKTTKNQVRG